MSKGTKSPPQPPPPERIEYAPPVGEDDRPPLFANTVVAAGGTDALVLTFYHISPNTLNRIFGNAPPAPHIQRAGGLVTVRSEPIARIALPFTVAVDLVAEMFESIVQGVPEVQSSIANFVSRISAVAKQVEALKVASGTSPESASSEVQK